METLMMSCTTNFWSNQKKAKTNTTKPNKKSNMLLTPAFVTFNMPGSGCTVPLCSLIAYRSRNSTSWALIFICSFHSSPLLIRALVLTSNLYWCFPCFRPQSQGWNCLYSICAKKQLRLQIILLTNHHYQLNNIITDYHHYQSNNMS